ncbi:MAG: DUF3060 domain-containing protein [Proteobacteria bacterium]|nr:DUF3060 domain-containing protein [Pseudomonadota bacterium]
MNVTIAAVDRLAVNGSSNHVDVDAANKIAVTGSSNTVTYKKGISDAKPKTTSLGVENTIIQRK